MCRRRRLPFWRKRMRHLKCAVIKRKVPRAFRKRRTKKKAVVKEPGGGGGIGTATCQRESRANAAGRLVETGRTWAGSTTRTHRLLLFFRFDSTALR